MFCVFNNVGFLMIGEDISVCVCLVILILLFNEEGNGIILKYINLKYIWRFLVYNVCYNVGIFDGGRFFEEKSIIKFEMWWMFIFICKYVVNVRLFRGNLR